MKLINEIKKESGIDINLTLAIQNEKTSKLKFEPNVNLKRNFIPNLESEKKENQESQSNIINLNQSNNDYKIIKIDKYKRFIF